MELSPQDALRLNVLLANRPQAIRINESTMTVFGLSEQGESQIQLNPTGRDDQYLKQVKELLSGHVLGSPGGYPVYLQRWTRMGQMRDDSLERMLLLGEPEAVVATVCAQGLTDELARRAWWAMQDATNARHMLGKPAVVEGSMGPLLAAYLVEHLPFETEPEQQIETVRLVLQEGLLDQAQVDGLWRKAQRKPAYYVGFLMARPKDLPQQAAAHPEHAKLAADLAPLAADGNPIAGLLAQMLSAPGQAFIETVFRVFDKPSNQEVVNLALDAIAA
ncbi:MAG: sulfur reduction protein DsrS, partial [Sedimenticolaceae bacterium]